MKECSRTLGLQQLFQTSIPCHQSKATVSILQSSREVKVKRGQFKHKLAILAMAVKCCRKVGVDFCFFNITPGGMGAIKSNFKNPVVLVSGYSRDRARRGPAIETRGIMDRPNVSGRVRCLISTTNRRRRSFFHFLTLPSEISCLLIVPF